MNKPRLLSTVIATMLMTASAAAMYPHSIDWHDARWIGGSDQSLPFDSQYIPVFRLSFNLSMSSDCEAAEIIYGANDSRLMDCRMNPFGLENPQDSSYIKISFRHDSISISTNGYSKGITSFPLNISALGNSSSTWPSSMNVVINSVAGLTEIIIDNTPIARLNISPTPGGGDYTAFPVVADVGYDIKNGTATITDFMIENFRSPHNTLACYNFGTVTGKKIIRLPKTGMTSLRQNIQLPDKKISSAIWQTTARGNYDLYLNGYLISPDEYFNPGASQYNKSHYFQTHDLTDMLRSGHNQLGVELAEGWWSGAASFDPGNWNWFGDRQSFLGVLNVKYCDGTSDTFVTEPDTWEYSTDGPTRYGSLFQGEIHDASRNRFNSGDWHPAHIVETEGSVTALPYNGWPLANDYSDFNLIHDNRVGVKVFNTLPAREMTECHPGRYIYDMGLNHAGVPSITFRGLKQGQKIIMRYAEVLYPDLEKYGADAGKPLYENLRAAMAQDVYYASGAPIETFSPRSTYHGYRYIEITGLDSPLPLEDVSSKQLSSVDRFTSTFTCSDTLINQLVENIRNSTLSNIFSIPTDCPQRNERMGWSGDISVFAPALCYLTDARDFLKRHTRALRDCREPNAAFPAIAPMGGGFGGPLWQSAGIIIPWRVYLQYADTTCLRDNYPAMKDYIEMVIDNYIDPNDNHFRGTATWSDLGDWLSPQCNQNEEPLIFDSYLVYELEIMNKVAKILGHTDDAEWFSTTRDKRLDFINRTYFNTTSAIKGHGFGNQHIGWAGPEGGQPVGKEIMAHTTYAVPLALGAITGRNENREIAARLSKFIQSTSIADDGREYPPHSLMTGFIGTPWILYALTDNGYTTDAYSILLNRSYPSWLYPVTLGATSVWERLNSMTANDGFGQNNSMNSFNHYAFGCVYDWLIQRVAGINPDPESPGFKHFYLTPTIDPLTRLSHASATYHSPHGLIESRWEYDADTNSVDYQFTIPPGTTATLKINNTRQKLSPGTHHVNLPVINP